MNDEVIETSDTDERDALHTSDRIYWKHAIRRPLDSPSKRVKLSPCPSDVDPPKSITQDDAWLNSQDPLDMFLTTQSQGDTTHLGQPLRPRSRSNSIDPLYLFTQPSHKDLPISSPPQDFIPSSPSLTPPPPNQVQTSPPQGQSNHSSPLSLPSSSPPPAHPQDNIQDQVVATNLANADKRYSLRSRLPQQLHPYIHDQLMYKRQMRSNPEAIVKFALGGPSRRRSASREKEQEDETQEWRMDVEDEDDNWVDRRRAQPSPADAHPGPTWLPEALQLLLPPPHDSDSEDEGVRDLLREAKRAKEKREKEAREKDRERKQRDEGKGIRKRVRPFPMRRDRQRSESSQSLTSPHPQTSSRPPKSKSPPISVPSTPSPRAPTQPHTLADDDLGPVDGDDYAWMGHADDDYGGGMDFTFSSPASVHVDNVPPTSRPSSRNSDPPTNSNPNSSEEESGSSSNELTSKDRKRLKALQRMMPAAMARQLEKKALQQAAKTKANAKRRRSTSAGEEDEEGPLLPGKTRVRIGRKGDLDIKGDTESEDGERGSDSTGIHPVVVPAHVTYSSDGVIEVESSSGNSSSDDEVDDAKIGAWFEGRPRSRPGGTGRSRPLREESLVDWMLTRTRTVGGQGNRRKKTSTSTRRTTVRYPSRGNSGVRDGLDVVIGGAQKERQTLLSFDNHNQPQVKRSKHSGAGRPSHTSRCSLDEEDVDMDGFDDPELGVNKYSKAAKSVGAGKKKKKQAGPQVYVFTSKGTRITSGRRRTHNAITIDVEDEGFHHALVPEGANAYRPPIRRKVQSKAAHGREYHNGAAMNILMDIDVGDYDHLSPPPRPHQMQQTSFEHRRDIKVDFEIHFLPSGLAFRPHTYIGKGLLHELVTLVSGGNIVGVPLHPYTAHDITLGPDTSPSNLAISLVSVADGLLNFIFGSTQNHIAENINHWEGILRTIGQLLLWLPAHSTAEDCTLLGNALQEQLLRLVTHIEDREDAFSNDGTPLNGMVLSVYWFAIESFARFSCSMQKHQTELMFDAKDLIKYISLLAGRLHNYGIRRTLEPILAGPEGLDTSTIPERTAELWVCLFHLVSSCHVPTSNHSNLKHHHPFWRIVHLTLQRDNGIHAGLEASETTWRTIFSLCALSQFSVHGMTTSTCRLPASWELVAFALKHIRLAVDPEIDKKLSERILDKRDEYIWLITSRCFILCNRWNWRIDDASTMFNQLANIFRSRKFANLRREASDFPSFMLENNLHLLSQYKPSDTAFEIFLKLIVQALKDCHSDNNANAQGMVSSKLTKLLALAVPVGSVPFTKSSPPTVYELSMLYNRLSAVAVAIYLESSPDSLEKQLTKARSYVNFGEADDTTRVACIRGMMHFAILMRYRRLPLDNVLSWLAEMTHILVDEYQAIDTPANKTSGIQLSNIAKHRVMFSIQVLLGSVRRIIESSNIDPSQPQKRYPEPALLNGPWVTRIFGATTNLTHVSKTGLEIRRLVQAFLDARREVMPAPQHHHVAAQENQESQDDYGAFDLDLDDPELQAALGDNVDSSNENKAKDELVSQALGIHITPAIFRLVCKHFNDPFDTMSFEQYCQDADKWIDCWVGCANVLVQLGKTKWDAFLELGKMSWEKIIDSSWRRRVGLRFMVMLLQCDPQAYTTRNDIFVKVLLESIVAAKVTIENEYMSLVFSIDRLRYPLLRHIPCQPPSPTSAYAISVQEYMTLRLPILSTIFSNLADSLRKEAHGRDNVCQNQTYVGHVVTMLSTMQDVYDTIPMNSDEWTIYSAFCRDVFANLRSHPELMVQARLGASIAWGQTLQAI